MTKSVSPHRPLRPIDIASIFTAAFVRKCLNRQTARILEIGCGTGNLAALLVQSGYELVAVDSSPTAVNEARVKGVDARVAEFPAFHEQPFDAILFSRSLHHLKDPKRALEHARASLRPGGVLLVEDFAFHNGSARTLRWLMAVLQMLDQQGLIHRIDGTVAEKILNGHADWLTLGDHADELAAWEDLAVLASEVFQIKCEETPYLFRYVVEVLREDVLGAAAAASVLEVELATAAFNRDFLLGRRMTGLVST